MSHSHPLSPAVLPFCKKYPNQAAALFQAFCDLSLAQSWKNLQVIDLEECECVIIKGEAKKKSNTSSFVYPIGISTPTSLLQLSAIYRALELRYPSKTTIDPVTSLETSSETLYMAIIEKDSSIVYYTLHEGIVSPREVPE